MNALTLWAPFSVLNGGTHSANTQLVWLLLGLGSSGLQPALSDIHLREASGLDPSTVAAARALLLHEPLASCYTRPYRSCAALPVALLTNPGLSAGARLVYGQLQGVPRFAQQGGSFTYAVLSHLTGRSDDALRRAVAELAAAGWLDVTQRNRKSPVCFTLRHPVSAQLRARISSIRRTVKHAQYRGEAVLREFLNLLIALDEYKDNAAPDFLLNPFTGELMEFDRYYPSPNIAVEFNGAQHYEETDLATFEETVKQVGRDAMKAFICKARGIELVIIRPEDLSLKAIDQELPEHLPRRNLEGLEPLVTTLGEMAAEYREHSAEERAHQAPHRRRSRTET